MNPLHRIQPGTDRAYRALVPLLALVLATSFLTAAPKATETRAPAANPDALFYARPGPWGRLRCIPVYLEAPDSLVQQYGLPSPRPRWTFPLADADKLSSLFTRAGLSEELIQALSSPANQLVEGGYVHLFPPLDLLTAITPAARSLVYAELAKVPANEFHVSPVFILTDKVSDWYRDSGLPQRLVDRIASLAYRRGDTWAFSDVAALLNFCEGDAEIHRVAKVLTRTRGIAVYLEVDAQTDIPGVMDYWSTGLNLRRKDLEPLLRALASVGGTQVLDIAHLLPAQVRKLLFTYPPPELARGGQFPDCHWTSLNFFNYTPQEYLIDSRLGTDLVKDDFVSIEPPYRYGDILLFLDPTTGNALHSCIYLADDLVFTKNGRPPSVPWLIMRLDYVRRLYGNAGELRIQGCRHRDAK